MYVYKPSNQQSFLDAHSHQLFKTESIVTTYVVMVVVVRNLGGFTLEVGESLGKFLAGVVHSGGEENNHICQCRAILFVIQSVIRELECFITNLLSVNPDGVIVMRIIVITVHPILVVGLSIKFTVVVNLNLIPSFVIKRRLESKKHLFDYGLANSATSFRVSLYAEVISRPYNVSNFFTVRKRTEKCSAVLSPDVCGIVDDIDAVLECVEGSLPHCFKHFFGVLLVIFVAKQFLSDFI